MSTYRVSFEATAAFHVSVEAETPEEAGEAVENWIDNQIRALPGSLQDENVKWDNIECYDLLGDIVLVGEPERY